MNEVEKRELFEQERKIFEAGGQRADKRSGSFSFLTWSFFIAPLIACEEFLAAPFKAAAAEAEEAEAAQPAGACARETERRGGAGKGARRPVGGACGSAGSDRASGAAA